VLELVTAFWLGVIGACIGSFLNVVAYRMPRGMSVVWKPSHCPKCGHDIRARDNVPVLGWLLLRGRCRDCGEPISPRYAIVEAVMTAAFVLLAYVELFSAGANLPGGPFSEATGAWHVVWNPNWTVLRLYAYHCMLLSVLMAMLLIDQDKQRIPWRIVLLALIVVAACSWHWRHLYVDRRGMSRMPAYNAPLDALYGVVWGVSPWIIALGARHLRGRRSDVNGSLSSMALGAAVVGGFVGLRAMVRITVLWLIGWLILRVARTRDGSPLTPLAALWLATLLHLMFWKQLAVAFSW
jgi:leader peptidase (prepilin peptidase)/N-methyltransferase